MADQGNHDERRLERLVEESPLPERADHDAVNGFLVDTHRAWRNRTDTSGRPQG